MDWKEHYSEFEDNELFLYCLENYPEFEKLITDKDIIFLNLHNVYVHLIKYHSLLHQDNEEGYEKIYICAEKLIDDINERTSYMARKVLDILDDMDLSDIKRMKGVDENGNIV